MADNASNVFRRCSCGMYFATQEAAEAHNCRQKGNSTTFILDQNSKTLFQCDQYQSFFNNMATFREHPCAKALDNNNNEVMENENKGTSSSASTTFIWNKPAILLLIELYKSFSSKINSGKIRKKQVWGAISGQIVKKGYSVTAEQVSGRWKSLTRAYKNVKDSNSKSGAPLKEYEYEEELDEIFAKDPAVFPKYTLSSSPNHSNKEESRSTSEETEESNGECTAPPKKKKKTSHQNEIVNTFKQFVEDQKKEKERREALEREKIGIMASLVDILKSTSKPT